MKRTIKKDVLINWQNVNFGIWTIFRTIINYCWKGGRACCETDTTKNSRWYYAWMIDDRWLVSLTTSRQSHIQTCLFADNCIMYGPLYEHCDYVVIQQDIDALAEWESKIVSEYDQEIPQSQTADNPVAPRGRAAQPSRDTRKTN